MFKNCYCYYCCYYYYYYCYDCCYYTGPADSLDFDGIKRKL